MRFISCLGVWLRACLQEHGYLTSGSPTTEENASPFPSSSDIYPRRGVGPPPPLKTQCRGTQGYVNLTRRASVFYSYLLAHDSSQNPSMASISPTGSPNPPHAVHRSTCLKLCFSCLAVLSSLSSVLLLSRLSYPGSILLLTRPTPTFQQHLPLCFPELLTHDSFSKPALWPPKLHSFPLACLSFASSPAPSNLKHDLTHSLPVHPSWRGCGPLAELRLQGARTLAVP